MLDFYLNYFTNDESFPLFAQLGGHDEPLYMHTHADFAELSLITDGKARHIIGGDSYPIACGEVFIIHRGVPHAFEETDKLRLYNIMFDPRLLPDSDISESAGFKALFISKKPETENRSFSGNLSLDPKDMEPVTHLFQRIYREFSEKRIGWKTAVHGDFLRLTVTLSRLYDFGRAKDVHVMEKIAGVATFIEQNYAENISVARLAEMSNYSLRQFIRLFKTAFGCIPTEYIANLRMQKARELLRGKTMPITDIALNCGYGDSNYFSRMFRKYNGLTPSEYRARF